LKIHSVHSITPKAGLIGMLAAYLVGIKLRIHTFTGQVWSNKSGLLKVFLKFCDFLISLFASKVFVDSKCQLKFLLDNAVLKESKASVLCSGSIVGVDLNRFKRNNLNRANFRKTLSIESNDIVFLFVGRINIDKGIFDLINAFLLCKKNNFKLLIVGKIELSNKYLVIFKKLINSPSIIYIDYTFEPEKFMNISDVLFLPSYREGFGNVIIEAAAMGLPAVVSDIYGTRDAVIEGITGFFHKPGSVTEILHIMNKFISNNELINTLGKSAKDRVVKKYSQDLLVDSLEDYYLKTLNLN
jgi:glycosyltransferase involved in cell wall biosynthesis